MKTFINTKPQKLSKAVLSNCEGLSFSAVMKLIREKDVKVNGVRKNSDVVLSVGDSVIVYNKATTFPEIPVIFEDQNVLVVNKPSGVLSETLYDNLKVKSGELYFIHRLDRNTSGVMIFAKNTTAEAELLDGFKNRTFDKKYLAEVYGSPCPKQAILTAYLKKDAKTSTVKVFDKKVDGSVLIKTGYKVLKTNGDTSLLEVSLYTGKTHQIRAHLSHIGHFIVGDGKYGNNAFNKSKNRTTQALSAYSLTLKFDKDSPLFYLNNKTFITE